MFLIRSCLVEGVMRCSFFYATVTQDHRLDLSSYFSASLRKFPIAGQNSIMIETKETSVMMKNLESKERNAGVNKSFC